MKNVKFLQLLSGETDIISVGMLVDDIEGESMDKLADNKMINKIQKLLQEARTHVAVEVNNTLLRTYMEIGKLLVEDINLHENEENYQNKTISMLSKELTRKFGKGFSRANIWNMITFYKEYGSVQTLSERLSWSHYCELLSISDKDKRHFYEVECANSRWSVRELRRQIASSLFERLLLSDGETNKQKVLELALKEFEKHEDSDIVGRGFNMGVMKRDFECMKWIGANSFRTSHYPYSEEIYQMADREGFLVIDEVAAVGLFRSLMNFLDATNGKQTSLFEQPTVPQLLENHLQCIEDMICRDKNHACVIAWSLLNEPETTDEAAIPYFEKVFAKAQEVDPQKGPRTFAMIMNSSPDKCKCYPFSDFISLNRYYGWYEMGGAEISDAEEAFRAEMDAWKEKGLNKPFVFTEYGADTNGMEHKLPSVMWSQEYQIEYLEMCHRVFDSCDFVKDEMVWNFDDFQTTEGILRMNGNKKGIFTRQRQPKMAAFYYKMRWEQMPLDYKKQ